VPLPLNEGEVLHDRYKVRERIGQGGAGSIYLADDLRLEGRQCAVKEVEYDRALPENLLDEARQQFLREATILARLDHPNLPKVSDFFSIGFRDYLVMDYVPGKDLRTMMLEARRENKFLPEQEVLGWAHQLTEALEYLHTQQPPIVHRDIKPSNLKITPSGLLKLVDFGLVRILAPEEVTITIIQGQGTVLYTPIEQYGADESHTDVRTDIYSFGATLYHLFTNEPPIDARNRFLQPSSLKPPRELNPTLSEQTEQAILWAMELHPDDRPASINALKEYLFGSTKDQQLIHHASTSPLDISPLNIFDNFPDIALLWVTVGLMLLSLIVTLTH